MFETRMPFGKYRGCPLNRVPVSYLCWVLRECDNIDLQLRTEIRRVVEKARQDAYAAHDEEPVGAKLPVKADEIVARWFRPLALKYHPDRSGSTEVMAALNFAREQLVEVLEETYGRVA